MEAETTQPNSVETYYRIIAWVHARRKPLLIGVGVVAAVGLGIGLMSWNKAQNAENADAKLFELPVGSGQSAAVLAPPPSAYLDIAKQYPNTSAGEYSSLLGAGRLFTDGNYTESERAFSQFITDYPDSLLIAQAKMGVAASLEAQGKNSEALQKYQAVVSAYATELNVAEPAKLTMARLYEQENRPDQALTFYSELARSQNPYDPWAAEARERGELLLAKHPELRQSQAPPPGTAPAPSSAKTAAPAPAPATTPAAKPQGQGLNLLNFPANSSAAPTKKP
ncbi:MAG TPA: tetratricopeptide repeat protein [Verrucomicrobiae bacterium]|jgi:predicted negative regulator of RcsB-dependent stress response